MFLWRRVHSLMGFWLVLYLCVHLLTNSQAALWFGNEGSGFIRLVNALESLPYLHAIEVILIGIPLAIHMVWGVHRAITARSNIRSSDGTRPSLKYERNRAYSLQRISSWILLVGIIGHVIQMRFLEMPKHATRDYQEQSMVKISFDQGLYTLAPKLGVTLYNRAEINKMKRDLQTNSRDTDETTQKASNEAFDPELEASIDRVQRAQEEQQWIKTLSSYSLRSKEVIAVAPSPGTAILLMVRNTFKSPLMAILYTIFVLAAAFHAFNGFWTFLIAWGAILSYRSQKSMIPVCLIAAVGLATLGLAAIWGSYRG
jgi:succinate dehydrogenase / fumarate reductase cytochrome b subunit